LDEGGREHNTHGGTARLMSQAGHPQGAVPLSPAERTLDDEGGTEEAQVLGRAVAALRSRAAQCTRERPARPRPPIAVLREDAGGGDGVSGHQPLRGQGEGGFVSLPPDEDERRQREGG